MEEDHTRTAIAEQLVSIAERLETQEKNLRYSSERIKQGGNVDEVQTIINEIMWLTPNLGLQALISRMVRHITK